MNDFFRWLLGVKDSPEWAAGGDYHLEFHSLPAEGWVIGAVLLVLLAAAGIWFLYKKEGRAIPTPMRLLLAAVRFAILSCVVFMLLEMVLVITKQELVPSHLLILVDASESMGLTDPYTEDAVALFGAGGVKTVFENLEGFPMDWQTNPEGFVRFVRAHQVPSFLEYGEYPFFSADEIKKALKAKRALGDMLDQMQ
jgi:hypothetical protein